MIIFHNIGYIGTEKEVVLGQKYERNLPKNQR